jgi:RNA polymerase sigma-70 factor, ECF subfamily
MTENDRFYIERCLDGHPDDFRHLVRRYQSVLIASLTFRLRSRDGAEDAAQEAFVRAYFNLSKLKKPDSFLPWLMGIAGHVAGEYRRKERKACRQDDAIPTNHTISSAEGPSDVDLDKAISALPDACRDVILLKFYGELSCQQIAEKLEIPLGTVTKTLSRAYAMLRQSLERDRMRRQEVSYAL